MGRTITLSIEGKARLAGAIARIRRLSGDARAPLAVFGLRMQGWAAGALRRRRNPETGAPHRPLGRLSARLKAEGIRKDRSRLLNSIVSRAPVVTATSVTIGSNLVYANIQQEGGTVRPRVARHLAIPLTRKAARAVYARRFFAQNKGAFIRTSKAGNKCVFLSNGDGGITAHFLLLKEAIIPARPYLGFPPSAEDALVRDFERHATRLAFGGA